MMIETFEKKVLEEADKSIEEANKKRLNRSFENALSAEGGMFDSPFDNTVNRNIAQWLGVDEKMLLQKDTSGIYDTFKRMYSGVDENGVKTRGLKQIHKMKVNPDFKYQNLKQQSGFSAEVISTAKENLKAQLEKQENTGQAVHFADVLLQYLDFQVKLDTAQDDPVALEALATLRDKLLAQNINWIAAQESQSGHDRIFVTGHNTHVARWESSDSMGKLLADEMGKGYYVIGTDFYKTCCNVPDQDSGKRTNQVFYSRDPLANAAKKAGFHICWLDFSKIPAGTPLGKLSRDYVYQGNLGEGYVWHMRLLPPSYRLFQPPATLYDSMIFVSEATPIQILEE